MLHAVIMAGGAGTRFWPASRADSPKQLLTLVGDRSMIQSTVDRLGNLVSDKKVLIVTNQRLVEPVAKQLPELPKEAVIGEPCKRDTAPCIGLAAGWVMQNDPDAIMVVMPSDHVIRTDEQFQYAISHAAQLVQQQPSRLVTFGIRPSYPAESFGYIERGAALSSDPTDGTPATFRVVNFHEKPNTQVAEQYLASGTFLWNSGIFVWKARTILELLQRFEPKMYEHLCMIIDAIGNDNFSEVFAHEFDAIQGRSIDYAVMERADDVVMVEAPFEWDDVGSWQALPRLLGIDDSGNTIQGKHHGIDTSGTIVRGTDDHLVVTLGLEDCIVVHTPDATLVASKDREEAIRDIVKQLEERGCEQYL